MPTATLPLDVVNAESATFDCIYGRGCDGLCCKNGRPSLSAEEQSVVSEVLDRVLPLLRPNARKTVERDGFVSRRTKLGQPMLKVVDGWCVFFNSGCVLHKLGLDETGDFTAYKPFQCVVFPLEPMGDGRWYVRQHGYQGERWDVFCLDPKASERRAVEALAPEIAYIARREAAEQ